MKDFTNESKSALKLRALQAALAKFDPNATISNEATTPAQPVGRNEVLRGARRRARKARQLEPDTHAIAIENGIREVDGVWEDFALIVLITADGREFIAESEAIVFPTDAVLEAQRRGFATTTVGSVLAEWYGCSADDPHSYLTHGEKSRESLLTAALEDVLRNLAPTGDTAMKTHHTITIGSVTRQLPIREVAPDVRVALFNILGDWELTEAIGTELAARIPAGIDALIMPDGKAQALLHVMGRVSGLPTFVARKELKPYMAEPVAAVTVKSITTQKQQALYLGSEDAQHLLGKKVAIVDDVVSTGGTLGAMRLLLEQIGATPGAVMAAFTEGDAKPEVIALGHLPLF